MEVLMSLHMSPGHVAYSVLCSTLFSVLFLQTTVLHTGLETCGVGRDSVIEAKVVIITSATCGASSLG